METLFEMRYHRCMVFFRQIFRQKAWLLGFTLLFTLLQTMAPLMHAHWRTSALASTHAERPALEATSNVGVHMHVETAYVYPATVTNALPKIQAMTNPQAVEDILELDKSMVRDQTLLLIPAVLFVLFAMVLSTRAVFQPTFPPRVIHNTILSFISRRTPPRAPPL